MVPASFDFSLANLNREASSAGTSIPFEELEPDRPLLWVDLSSAPGRIRTCAHGSGGRGITWR
jgi:hypothetical protein